MMLVNISVKYRFVRKLSKALFLLVKHLFCFVANIYGFVYCNFVW